MRLDESTASFLVTQSGTAEPLYFRSGESDLFGWLHRPTKPLEFKLGAVICSPYGYESICAHRSVRAFAEAFSDSGIPSLRFDYASTGDSSEIDENADHLSVWIQDVLAAIRELRARTGVERVCLLGIRLGTLFASLAAARCSEIESLILVGPVISGRRFVRELRTMQLAGLAFSGSPPPELAAGRQGQKLEAGGFSFSAATIESLARVDLLALPAPPVPFILVLDNDKLPSAKRWVESLSSSGAAVEYRTLPGLVEMTMTAPQFATIPQAMIDAARDWISRFANSLGNIAAAEKLPPNPPLREPTSGRSAAIVLDGLQESSDGDITEYPAWIPTSDAWLFGIVTEPVSGERRRRAVILLNPGADFHIGASRMYVSLARRWARRGYLVLRLDFAGIGDSPTRPGKADDEVFPEEALVDIRSAVEYMRTRYTISDMTLAGLCSGAYHALRAAVAGLDINRILMINPQNYFWDKGMSLHQVQLAEVAHNPGLYLRRMFTWGAWKRLYNGQVDIGRIAIIYVRRLQLGITSCLRSVARLLHIRLRQDLALELEKITASGIRVTFVFARGEPGLDLLRLQAGSAVTNLRDKCRVRIVDSGDHIFSRREHRDIMENVLSEELFAPADGPAEPGGPGANRSMMLSTK